MQEVLIVFGVLLYTAYGVLAATARPTEPLWYSWPARLWPVMKRHIRPAPQPRPDYAKIARLERELGITGD